MTDELILEHPKVYRSQQSLYKNNSFQKKLFPNYPDAKKDFIWSKIKQEFLWK